MNIKRRGYHHVYPICSRSFTSVRGMEAMHSDTCKIEMLDLPRVNSKTIRSLGIQFADGVDKSITSAVLPFVLNTHKISATCGSAHLNADMDTYVTLGPPSIFYGAICTSLNKDMIFNTAVHNYNNRMKILEIVRESTHMGWR